MIREQRGGAEEADIFLGVHSGGRKTVLGVSDIVEITKS